MKRKVGELYNKLIVVGNVNKLTSNEILLEKTGDTISLKERINGEVKNVAQSGEGSASGGIEDIYLDASAIYDSDYNAVISAYKRRLNSNGAIVFVPRGLADNPYIAGENIACIIMSNTPFTNMETGELTTVGESVLEMEASGRVLPRITKEEFYTLN